VVKKLVLKKQLVKANNISLTIEKQREISRCFFATKLQIS
jgi:hypothetical protein